MMTDGTRAAIRQVSGLKGLVLFILLALAAWLAVRPIVVPPAALPASAPPDTFSAGRALEHLRVIAAQPHPVGSPANLKVRDYIVQQIRAMGLTPVVQEATGTVPGSLGLMSAHLYNILARINGTDGPAGGAVGVMAHYDSQPNTPAAADDGVGSASLLETMRAILAGSRQHPALAGPTLHNDLIFIFTDCEELDAEGSQAFYTQHPWAKEIRVMINLESGSPQGGSFLTQTTPGNLALAKAFEAAAPQPVAYSFLTQLLTIIPGGFGTDMSIFAENGVPGLEPMFGLRFRMVYHSALDKLDALDPGTLQHQGGYTLGLARYFGNLDLAAVKAGQDATFFTLFPSLNVVYPASWALPLAILAGLLLLGLLVGGLIRGRLSVGGILAGTGLALARILVPVILAAVVWMAVAAVHPEFWRNLMGSPYQASLYLLGFVALVAAASLGLFALTRRAVSAAHQTVGALLLWFILALLTALSLPGMSYLFTWPLLATTLLLGGIEVLGKPVENASAPSWGRLAGLAAAGIVILVMVAPAIVLLYILLGFWFLIFTPSIPFIAAAMLFVALALALLTPQMEMWASGRRWLSTGVAAALAVILLAFASLTSGFSPSQPMQNGVWYEMNADSGSASWYSLGTRVEDAWTAQFFPVAAEPVAMVETYPALSPLEPVGLLRGPAPAVSLPGPELSVVSDQTTGGVRILSLHLSSPRGARALRVEARGAPVLSASSNGSQATDDSWPGQNRWLLRYYGLDARGLDLVLEVQPGKPLTLVVADQSEGLPALAGVTYIPRSADMIPFALAQEMMPYSETTSVTRTFELK